MIRYTLKCSEDHSFESWFASATAFETLQAAGQLSCPHCGSDHVTKSLMTPRVSTARKSAASPESDETQASTVQTSPQRHKDAQMPSEQPTAKDAEATLTAMRDHIEKNADYVGTDFTTQARAMNDGEAPERSIYGEAKFEDAKAMIEDGLPIVPLPFLPKRKLN
ncbi:MULTISPECIES: DUF1178 family protein [Pacificibacter]|uniref:DUF1178 family protein n=1 Tax=Pacificibacter TaxID=1042323 RepID=UPI001C086BEA|nr:MULTISPECIES: DUF1178 family protein [Pacificibacter]MBU2937054.1 DUF1178 family protein [Pacificibacter marinus]MDO6616406.1 DUF1178 family protein [Pacificibacter sp. 1_MG-2023]